MRRREIAAAALCAAVAVASFAAVPPAAADTLTIDDPARDVARFESGDRATQPLVDITSVRVDHRARSLEVRVEVAEVLALDDDAWEGQLYLEVVLRDPDASGEFGDGVWVWTIASSGGDATGTLTSVTPDFELVACATDASADEERLRYVLRTGMECLRDVPRAVQVGVGMTYNDRPDDPDWFDHPFDTAPDDDLSAPVQASGAGEVTRLAGNDRIETAIALVADRFGDGEAPAAVVASADAFADALAGGPLATVHGAPMLLTGSGALDPRVADELARILAPGSQVFVLGGTASLGEAVVTDIRALGLRPRRVAGANRFETAVAVADEIGEHELVLIADGRSFRDALIAAAAAAGTGGVVVLSDGSTLPSSTDGYLANDPTRHVAIGTAAAAAPGAERVTAASASELAQKVLDRLLPDISMIAVATEDSFADALAGSPHLASLGGGLLLSDSTQLSPAAGAELTQRAGDLREVVLYGGTAALSPAVESAVTDSLSTE